MDSNNFNINLLSDLNLLKNYSTDDLERLVVQYPYFQTAHLLLAKHYYENQHDHYDGFLKKASALAVDRSKLYEIIHDWNSTEQLVVNEEIIEEAIEESIEEESSIEEIIESLSEEEEFELPKDFNLEELGNTLASINQEREETEEGEIEDPMDEEIDELITQGEEAIASSEILVDTEEEVSTESLEVINESDEKETPITGKKSFLDWIKAFNEVPAEDSEEILDSDDEVSTKEETEEIEVEAEPPITYRIELPNKQPMQSFVQKEEEENIIDQFIELDKKQTVTPNLEEEKEVKPKQEIKRKASNQFGLVSETLAIIHAKQGKLDKAIEIYEQLILQEPKKSAYFASQIEKLKNNI